MRQRLWAIPVAAIALMTAAVLPASAASSPPPLHTSSAVPAGTSPTPEDFSGGSTASNVKIESWDDACLTYAHPTARSAVGLAPCNGSHNFDIVTSPDGLQVVWKIHGYNLAIGDFGGVIEVVGYNTTSDSLEVPVNTAFSKNGVEYQGFAFAETNPNFIYIAHGPGSSVVPQSQYTIHCDWRSYFA